MSININSYVLEDIDWESEEVKKILARKKPKAKYGKLSEKLRANIPEETMCAMLCGGKNCKYCYPPGYYSEEQMTIKGLYSSWVTENLLAMSRPSTKLIEDYGIIKQFKDADIHSLINLQTPGEHFSCGEPLESSGFSYNVESFMDNGIFFYNFGWPDYGVGGMNTLLDMVRVMQFAVSEGKVAIHCHAGLGRTGVLIAVYLIFNNRMSAGEAIQYIRTKRKGAIQTKGQISSIKAFDAYLTPFRIIFADSPTDQFTLSQYLMRQKHMLHGFEARRLKHIPKILYICCERLIELAHRGRKLKKQAHVSETFRSIKEVAPNAFNNRPHENNDLRHARSCNEINTSEEKDSLMLPDMVPRCGSSNDIYDMCRSDVDESDSSSSICGDDKDALQYSDDFSEDESSIDEVIQSLVTVQHTNLVKEAAEEYKVALNTSSEAWHTLSTEKNPYVISLLIWEWFDQLREPVISYQDINMLAGYTNDPFAGLGRLDRATHHTTEYLVNLVTRLLPLPSDNEDCIMLRIISVLTQQNVWGSRTATIDQPALTKSERIMKSDVQQKIIKFFYILLDRLESKLNQKKIKKTPR